MGVAVVEIGIVRMLMPHRLVAVPMCVWFLGGFSGLMRVLMVFVVNVPVLVFQALVDMSVFVPLCQVQP